MDTILIRDIMVKNPYTLNIKDNLSKVPEYFKRYRIRHLPIVDNKKLLCGIMTQRDLYRICSPRRTMDGNEIYDKLELDRYIMKHVMTKNVAVLDPMNTLAQAIDIMVRKKCGSLPVVDKKRVVGIITHTDVLKAIIKHYLKRQKTGGSYVQRKDKGAGLYNTGRRAYKQP